MTVQITEAAERVKTALLDMYPRESLSLADVAEVLNDAIIGRQIMNGRLCTVHDWIRAARDVQHILIRIGDCDEETP